MDDNIFPFPGDGDLEDLSDLDLDMAAFGFSLTVAEGKRLIAKGVVADSAVQESMEEGMVAVCKGSTNAYVLEELLGGDIDKGKYVLGKVLPVGDERAPQAFKGSIPEVIFRQGEVVEGMTVAQAVTEMSVGDVVLKGANIIDYATRTAGVLIGHPAGGTLGSILGSVYGKGLSLIIPVGLEKQTATPAVLSKMAPPTDACAGYGIPRLWPIQGTLFTELEALNTLAGVQVLQTGAGGLCGAEGAVCLIAFGFEEEVEAAKEVISQVQGEPSFWDAVMGK
ncbi:hypothetical protein LLH03_09220 [bacterium]|nr:hypothetical protein [bacterium]